MDIIAEIKKVLKAKKFMVTESSCNVFGSDHTVYELTKFGKSVMKFYKVHSYKNTWRYGFTKGKTCNICMTIPYSEFAMNSEKVSFKKVSEYYEKYKKYSPLAYKAENGRGAVPTCGFSIKTANGIFGKTHLATFEKYLDFLSEIEDVNQGINTVAAVLPLISFETNIAFNSIIDRVSAEFPDSNCTIRLEDKQGYSEKVGLDGNVTIKNDKLPFFFNFVPHAVYSTRTKKINIDDMSFYWMQNNDFIGESRYDVEKLVIGLSRLALKNDVYSSLAKEMRKVVHSFTTNNVMYKGNGFIKMDYINSINEKVETMVVNQYALNSAEFRFKVKLEEVGTVEKDTVVISEFFKEVYTIFKESEING